MENTVKKTTEVQEVKKEAIKYQVKTRTLGTIKGTIKGFVSLTEARTIGMQHFKNGSFVHLVNSKGVKLPL